MDRRPRLRPEAGRSHVHQLCDGAPARRHGASAPAPRTDGRHSRPARPALPSRERLPMKHTPGPWTVDDGDSDIFGAFAYDGNAVCYLSQPDACGGMLPLRGREQDEANARLIAAAPDLLTACQLLTRYLEVTLHPTADLPAEYDTACRAIRKALGIEDPS